MTVNKAAAGGSQDANEDTAIPIEVRSNTDFASSFTFKHPDPSKVSQ